MHYMGVNEIREKFLSFFESKGCLRLDSFSLIPKNDASLLLINSGMAPMKKWFTGVETPPRKRVTTCQKCIRTPDIERVGKTARHGTFFEMLGNFSFGDYFKHEAIAWAWEFFTEVLHFPVEDLWITVYEEDDEARDIWVNEIGVRPERVVKMGKEDNFWEHGTGPCGPCSEIHVDRGPAFGCGKPDCKLGCDCDRFMEVWNLVFTQFDKDENGNYNRLEHPNIDTGMGLERLAVVMQGVDNLFEIDTMQEIMGHISRIAGVQYKQNEKTDISLRVITDHIRSTVMMVADGVIPSNEGRGYVLRRLLRRAARHGKLLNIQGAFLHEVADTVIDASKQAYPELDEKRDYIKKIIKIEEERFDATIDNGLTILSDYINAMREQNQTELSGEKAFKLYDTYGFPIDLTIEILDEQGLGVDEDGFQAEMQKQKDTARARRKDGSSWEGADTVGFNADIQSEFIGYNQLECEATVMALTANGDVAEVAGEGDDAMLVCDKTVFYGESGGQVGDRGTIVTDMGRAEVIDTQKFGGGQVIGHFVKVIEGEIHVGDQVQLAVDRRRRMATARNHSATHLLHKALKEVLGAHVAQAGSLVTPDHLRFDFSHFEAMTQEELEQVEQKVNDAILDALPVTVQELPIDEAKKLGATAQFGEKYGEIVRVVKMGDYSIEFCGGCHLHNTAEAGLFKILSEGGVAAGTRRIEAVTGYGVLDYISQKEQIIARTAQVLKTTVGEIHTKAEAVLNDFKDVKKKLESVQAKMATGKAEGILAGKKTVAGVEIVCAQIDGLNVNDLRMMGDNVRNHLDCGIVVLASETEGKIMFLSMATKAACEKGVHAGNIIKEITKIAGGTGGGKPDMAQGGGKDRTKIDDALAKVDEIVTAQIQK